MRAKRPEILQEICQNRLYEILSHVLVMYDWHTLLNILCIASVRNKHLKKFLQSYLAVVVCTADTCM